MKTELEKIIDIITNYSAINYASKMIDQEREFNKNNYYEYMRDMWSNKENPPIEECVKNSRKSKISKYIDAVNKYLGWVENGCLFVLNKKERFVFFLYKVNAEGVHLVTNYNPTKFDCLEEWINKTHLDDKLLSGEYELSTNEAELNNLCDQLIYDSQRV